ncbi:transporter substrate-binding domain-containing protein [Marinobacter sp. CHS3-4]|uniref:substrate-binding periplasmic protein n=1 Tax=Marinobacter sp. CHS3-4 TaxID=3045174 RepID=UPI0024B5F539|nr:transporter substrate-binding domain-containing protein [Marinobacter sp. CHS3-4]MDI9245019.1 transporter substrate-binding domain-containing protein [Marinobacter sp. CHS3-4]
MVFVKRRRLSSTLSDGGIRTRSLNRVLRFIALLLVGVAVAPVSLAESDTKPVTFAIADVWPWAYEDQRGKPSGSLVDVMRRLSELTDVPVEPRLRPVRRAISELKNGHINFSILFQSPDLDRQAVNLGKVVQANILLAATAETDYPLTLESLSGKSVAYIRGTYLGEAFEQNTEVVKVPVTLISQAIDLLSIGRISAILASDHAILKALEAMGLSSDVLRYNKHVPGQSGVLYMSGKAQRSDAAMKFREAIALMDENGELNRIFFGESGRPEYDGPGEPDAASATSAQ